MSTVVDSRVVEMRFDNKQFEAGTKKTISTLSRLKEALKLPDASKTLENMDKAARNVQLNGLLSGVEALNKKFSAFGVASMTVVNNVTNALMGKLNSAVHAVTNSIVSGGIKRAMNIENAHFQLQALMGDETKVQAIMADAMESVDGTAYAYDEAAKAASQFAASGLKAGEEMLGALKGITGVAAMTNSSFESISTIFTTVAGNGRLMGDQLLQLSSRGLNAASTLADYFKEVRKESSITEGDIRTMVTKGELDFKTFADAMGWAFGDSAKRANETFTGAMSNMKSALARIGAEFVSPLIEQNGELVQMFNALRIKINEVKSELTFDEQRSAIAGLAEVTGMTDTRLEKIFTRIKKEGHVTTKQLGTLNKKGASATKALTEYINGVADGSIRASYATKTAIDEMTKGNEVSQKKVRKFVKKGKVDLDMFTSAMEETYGKEQTLSKQFTDMVLDTISKLRAVVENADVSKPISIFYKGLDSVKNVLGGLRTVLIPVKNAFGEVFSLKFETIDILADSIVNLTSKMKLSEKGSSDLHDAFKGLFDFGKLLADVFIEIVTAIAPVNKEVLDVGDSFLDLVGFLGRMLSKFTESARESEYLGKAIDFISGSIKKTISGLSSFSKWLMNIVKSIAKFKPATKTVSATTTAFTKLGKVAGPYVSSFTKTLTGLVKEFAKFADSTIGKSVDFISKSFQNLFNRLKSFTLSDVAKEFKNFANTVKEFFASVGNSEGLATFIENIRQYGSAVKEGTAFDAVLGNLTKIMRTMGNFISWIKDTFGPAVAQFNFGSAFSIAGFLGIVKSLNDVTGSFSKIVKTFEKIPTVLTSLNKSLQAYQTKLKAEAIESIAKAIAVLAGSLLILSFADPENLMTAATAIGLAGGALFAALGKLQKSAKKGQEATDALMTFSEGFKTLLTKFGKSLEMKALGVAIKDVGIAIALITGSIIAIGYAYSKDKAAMDEGVKAVGMVAAAAIGIMVIMAKLADKLGENSKGVKSIGIGLAGVAVAIFLAATSIRKLFEMQIPEDYSKKLLILGGLFVGVGLLLGKLGKATGKAKEGSIGLGNFVGVAALLYVSVTALNKLFKMELPADYGEKILIFIALFGGISLLLIAMGAMSKLAGNGTSQAKDIGSIGNLLLKTVAGLMLLTKMPADQLLKGAVTLGLVIVAVGAALALAGKVQSEQSAKAISAMNGVLTTITASLGVLALIPMEQLLKAALSLDSVLASIALALWGASKNVKQESYANIILMVGTVLVIALTLREIAGEPWEGLLAAGTAIGEVLLSLSASMAIISKVKIDSSGVGAFLLGMGAIAEIAIVLLGLANQPWDGLLAAGTAISEVLLAMSAALVICSKAGKAGKAALVGIGLLDVFIADLAAVLVALGALRQIDGFDELVNAGGEMFVKLGQVLGDFVGAIINGVINGFSASIADLGTYLSMFMVNLTPFLTGIKMITEDMLIKAGWLSGIILAFMAEGALNGVLGIIVSLGLVSLGAEMSAFIIAMSPFLNKLKELDQNALTAAETLANVILALTVSSLIDGISKFLGIKGNLKTFADSLEPIGNGVKSFSESIKDITDEDVKKAETAASVVEVLANVSKKLYGSGGLVQKIFGGKSLLAFSNGITKLGEGLVGFIDTTKDVTKESVSGAVEASELLSGLQTNLEATGGVIQWFEGKKDLKTFGKNLKSYGESLASFINSVAEAGVTKESVSGAKEATDLMTEVANNLPDTDVSFVTFGQDLAWFGEYLVEFLDKISGLDFSSVSSWKTAMNDIISVAKNAQGISFEDFAGLSNLGNADTYSGMHQFVDGIGDFKDDAESQVRSIVNSMVEAFKRSGVDFQKQGKSMMNWFTTGFKPDQNAFQTIIRSIVEAISKTYGEFRSAGQHVATGFINGIKTYNRDSYLAGYDLGKEASRGTKEALKEKSPSKVMREIGNFAGLGFILEFQKFVKKGYQNGKLLGESTVEGTKYGIDNLSTVFYDADLKSPVIKPRADLSNIRESASQISTMFNQAVKNATVTANDIQLKMAGRTTPLDLMSGELKGLRLGLEGVRGGDVYNLNGINYSENEEVGEALKTIVQVARIKGRA